MKQIGDTGIPISDMVYGCWQMGGDEYWGKSEDEQAVDNIRTAYDLGIHTFDTAYIYGLGHSECVLGQALQKIPRENCCVISKLWQMEMHYEDAIRNCEDSLKRLKTDYLDVYFVHYPDYTGTVPIEETLEAFNLLKEQGKIRAIGLSNFSLKQTREAMRYAKIDIVQPCYSLLWRYADKLLLPFCREQNISVIPYSPLAQGLLTGKFHRDNKPTDDRSRVPIFQSPYYEKAVEVVEVLEQLSGENGWTPAEMALSWVAHQTGITAPIVGFRHKEKIPQSLNAVSKKLDAEAEERIEKASRNFTDQLPFFLNFFDNTIVEDPDKEEQTWSL